MIRRALLAGFLAGWGATLLQAQDGIMSSEQPESIALPTDLEAAPAPTPAATPSLFTPVVPGMPQSRPGAAPTPKSPLFLPPDIPAPAIQATPTTTDVIPGDAAALAEPKPTPSTQAARPVIPQRPAQPVTTTAPAPAATPPPQQVSQAQISAWVTEATQKQDANLATKAGWAYFNRGEFSSAGMWFNQALEWNPGNGEAAYGLAFSKFREGDLSSAEAIVNFRGDSYPKMRVLKGDISSRRAVEAYEGKNYAKSRDLLLQAAQSRPLSRNEQTVLAWDYYYLKDYSKSAELFEKLYRASPSENTAQGLYASLSRTGSYDRVDTIGDTVKGPLKTMYGTSEARRYFKANLYVASAGTGGEKLYRVLENYTSPSVAAGFLFSSKSGTEGEGKLNIGYIPVISGRIYPSSKTILTAQVSRITLNAGDLPNGAVVGKYPRTFQPYSVQPTTSYSNLYDFSVRFEYQDWVSWYMPLSASRPPAAPSMPSPSAISA